MKEMRTSFINKKMIPLFSFILGIYHLSGQTITIPIATENNVIVMQTDNNNRLRTIYFGKPLENESEYACVSANYNYDESNAGIYNSSYTPAGTWNLSEPAIQVKHGDGNPSLELKYVSHNKKISNQQNGNSRQYYYKNKTQPPLINQKHKKID